MSVKSEIGFNQINVLIIDDERNLIDTIRLAWPDPGDRISSATSFNQAKSIIYSTKIYEFDCIIIDLYLEDASGSQVLDEVRQYIDTPVILLSAWGDSHFRADTIHKGADDYVMKPVSVRELHARVRRLCDRSRASVASPLQSYRIDAALYDHVSRELAGPNGKVVLTNAEGLLLATLARRVGRTVPRDDLYLTAFGRQERSGEKVLETYIGRLRRALTNVGIDGFRQIVVVRGTGYRLVGSAADEEG